MNFTSRLIAGALVLAAPAAFAQASASATANAGANIVTAITLTKTRDLYFGNFTATAGTATVAATSAGALTPGTTVPAGGTPTSAAFTVGGTGSRTFAITPITNTTISNGATTMVVNNFKTTPSGTGTLSTGSAILYVGADLVIGTGQAVGDYTGTFSVTVNYN